MLVVEIKTATSQEERLRKNIREGLGYGDREIRLSDFYHQMLLICIRPNKKMFSTLS